MNNTVFFFKQNFIQRIFYISLGYFTYLMVLITLQYIPINMEAAFLRVKQDEIILTHYQIAFFSHVFTSIFVLILGIFQFPNWIRNGYPAVHRNMGKIYVALVLFIASPSGLVIAIYANGGIYSKISFCIQAILWFLFTFFAYNFAKRKDWVRHRNFMFRSYALTLSAISLRLFKWAIVSIFEIPPMDTYKIVAWLGWIVNLLIVELYLRSQTFNKLK